MIYPWLEFYNQQTAAWLDVMRQSGGGSPWQQYLNLSTQFMGRNAGSLEPVAVELEEALAGSGTERTVLLENPFGDVASYRRRNAPDRLIFAALPHSGYAPSALVQFVTTLLTLGTVIVTEWRDPRLIAQDQGGFRLIDQISLIEAGLEAIGGPVLLLGLSQSGWPATLAAERKPHFIKALGILGAPMDPGLNPSLVQESLNATPLALIEQTFTSIVPDRYPGAGRRVFPAILQLMTHAGSSPLSYMEAQIGLAANLLNGQGDARHEEMHRLCDVPAELFLDMMKLLRQRPESILAAVAQTFDGELLADTPLLTVEAGADPLVAAGQTHVLAELLHSKVHLPVDIKGGDHVDLFVGDHFTRYVAGGIAGLIRASD